LGQIYALFLAKIYAQKAFLENTVFSTGRIFLGVYYRAYIFMDSRSVTNPMPSDINRLAVPALAKGLHVVVKPCNLRRSLLFKEIAILAVPRSPCLQNTLLMTVQASSMAPAVPGRRVGATVPGPRRVAIISGPKMSGLCLARLSTDGPLSSILNGY
jgi:hypothetical protein